MDEHIEAALMQAGAHITALQANERRMVDAMFALRKDAERYRYLRSRVPSEVFAKTGVAAGCWIDCEDGDGTLVLLTGEDADAAVDDAMAVGAA